MKCLDTESHGSNIVRSRKLKTKVKDKIHEDYEDYEDYEDFDGDIWIGCVSGLVALVTSIVIFYLSSELLEWAI